MEKKLHIVIVLILAAFVSLFGCGGGGGATSSGGGAIDGGGGAYPAKILRWLPPDSYSDSTPLNPSTDLDAFEIYMKTDAEFSANDQPMASLRAVDPVTGQITTSFDLANLGPYLQKGVIYYLSMRAVALDGLKSGFSTPASFSF